MPRRLFSYVVRFDSGFAPNPFHGYCTLATCKPGIRERANIGDWVVGTGSDAKGVRRGGHLVYAMRVGEILETTQYWCDPRFERKKPNLYHSWVAASGDNIYEPIGSCDWRQLDSYHTKSDGRPNERHIGRDTGVPRILISEDFVYYGGEGPKLPGRFQSGGSMNLRRAQRNYQIVHDEEVISSFEAWLKSQGGRGYEGKPWDWLCRRRGPN